MIFCFSGTGNSLNVAQVISETISEPILSIEKCIKNKQFHFTLKEGEVIGVVCGVHFFGVPAIVCDFLSKVSFSGIPEYVFTVVTYGTLSGFATKQIADLLKRSDIDTDARFSIRMVDTWTPMFDLSDTDRTYKKTVKIQPQIQKIADTIRSRKSGIFDSRRLPYSIGKIYYSKYNNKRNTEHFHVLCNKCNSCRKCSRLCPVGAIKTSQSGYPVWSEEKCTLCLRCLHNCSTHAIQYGNRTVNHGQFINPFAKMDERSV